MTGVLTTDHRAPHLIQTRIASPDPDKWQHKWETFQEWPTWRIAIIELAKKFRDRPERDVFEWRIIQKSLLEN